MKTKKTFIPFIVSLAAVLIAVISFFLPYTSMTGERRETKGEYLDKLAVEEIGITANEAIDVSFVEYIKIYSHMISNDEAVGIAVCCLTVICIIAFFTLLIVLFVCLRKAVPTIVFSLLDIGTFRILCWDFRDRGVIGNNKYVFSVSYYLFILAMIVILAAAIWLLVIKIKDKKANKEQPISEPDA